MKTQAQRDEEKAAEAVAIEAAVATLDSEAPADVDVKLEAPTETCTTTPATLEALEELKESAGTPRDIAQTEGENAYFPALRKGRGGIPTITIGEPPFPQSSFKKMMTCRKRYLIAYGGAAAGKSYGAAQKMIIKALKYPGSRIIVIRKFGPSLRLTAYKMLADIINWAHLSKFVHVRTFDMSFHFENGSSIQCIPIVNSTGEAADRIKSLTDVTDMWFEEVTELHRDEFEAILLRFRGQTMVKGGYRQLILTFNPINAHHWINSYFFRGESHVDKKDVELQKYTYLDNDYLDVEYKRYLESITDENMRKVYVLGEWGMLENQIYETYNDETDCGYRTEQFDCGHDFYDEIICGVDFGYVNPAAAVLIGIKTEAEHRTMYVIDEVYIHSALNEELISSVYEMFRRNLPEKYWAEINVYADTAEPMRVEEMRQAGLNMFEAKKDILDGINTVRQYEIKINPICDNFIKEIIAYIRKKDAEGNAMELPDKRRGYDHLMDAMRYAVYTWTLEYEPPIPLIAPTVCGSRGGRWNVGGLKSTMYSGIRRGQWDSDFLH